MAMIHPDGTTKSMNNAFNWQAPAKKAAAKRVALRPKTGSERSAYAMASDEERAVIRATIKARREAEILRVNRDVDIHAYTGIANALKTKTPKC